MWVPLIENNEHNKDFADPFVQQHVNNLLEHSDEIDTIILGCTHYPLLIPKIKKYLPSHIQVISQGEIVAKGLVDYLDRHPEIEVMCSKNSKLEFYTTDSTENFDKHAGVFFGREVKTKYLHI